MPQPESPLQPDPALDLLAPASQRLVRTVDALSDDDWTAPSLLPGWTRAHVVAHLALNADGHAAALTGLATGERVPVYTSQAAREAEIDELAGAGPAVLRDHLLGSVTAFARALTDVPPDAWDSPIERVPGGVAFPAYEVPGKRLREVEVHHADLGASYSPASWSPELAAHLITAMTQRPGATTGLLVVATDLDRSWTIGDGGPAVTGTAAALGWWLTGRGDGAGLTSEGGELPRMGAW